MDTTEKQSKKAFENPLLIFDRIGTFGNILIDQFSKDFLCVFVSSATPEKSDNVIHIPLTRHIPAVPKTIYKNFFLVYNGDRTIVELLPAFASKAKEDNAHIYFIVSIRNVNEKFIQDILAISSHITVLLLGDIFNMEQEWVNPVTAIMTQAKTGKIILKNNGMNLVYPVDKDDVLAIIKRIVHLKGISGHKAIYLFPLHPVTELSFAGKLQKKEPLVKIDMEESHDTAHISYVPKTYASALSPSYNYATKLPNIEIVIPKKKSKPTVVHKPKPKVRMPLRAMSYWLIAIILFIVFGLPIGSALLGVGYLSRVQSYVQKGSFTEAQTSAQAAQTFFTLADRSSTGLKAVSFIGLQGPIGNITTGIDTGKRAANAVVLGLSGAILLKNVEQNTSLDPNHDFLTGLQNIKDALVQESSLQAEGKIPPTFQKYAGQLDMVNHIVISLSDVLPHLVGMDGAKKYLVLFQNNMELRPGGGFIGSYGILDVNKGRIVNFPIQNVYDADGQLKEHIEPPFQLRRYLGISHWFLRDSNFDVDFPKSAANAAFFYNEETKGQIDGVIAIDASFMRNLLRATGPIVVPGYGETVTADNFFLLTEKYAQDNSFPGSTQKQDFLKEVATSLFLRLTETKNVPYIAVVSSIADSIAQKHLLVAFPDDSIQKVFNLNKMSSTLTDTREQQLGTFNDFFGLNEANLGMNKVNYYLDRSINHTVTLREDGTATENITVVYQNRSTKQHKYGGDYKAYVRYILPSGATLTGLSIDGVAQDTVPAVTDPYVFTATGFTPQSGLELEKSDELGKTIYGFIVIVPADSKKTVSVTYTISTNIPTGNPTIDYSLEVFKQPGTEQDPYVFNFTAPNSYKVLSVSDPLKITGGNVSLLTALSEDKNILINLGKK